MVEIRDKDLLLQAGEALYGERWQTDLARDIEVTDRTMRRWASGKYPVPPSAWQTIRKVLTEHGVAISKVRRQIPRSAGAR